MRLKKATIPVLVLSLLLSIGTFASGATAAKPAVKPANSAAAKSARLFPVSTNGKFSFVDVNGKEIFKTNFGFADDFVGGYAHIMNELGGASGYIDAKGNKIGSGKNTSKAGLKFRGAREIKGSTVIDLSKKVKRYTSTHDGLKANNEDYNIGDGFEVRIWTATGAPCISLYKNGKIICDKSKQLKGQDIFLIVKYDNEKIIRFLYADSATGKLKTLYVDYNGNPIWTKTAQANLVSAAVIGNPSISPSTASFIQGAATTDLSVVLTPKGNTFKGIKGLTQGTQYTVSANTVTILKSYLNTLSVGTKALTLDFGASNNPVLTITITAQDIKLNIAIGNLSGKAGDTITVPITLTNVAKVGNIGTLNFYIGYDTNLLEGVSVNVGDIVLNAQVNFSSRLNDGLVSIVFLDNTLGNELITTDGILATITFKVKGTSSATAPLEVTVGAFGDGKMKRIQGIEIANGSIKIN